MTVECGWRSNFSATGRGNTLVHIWLPWGEPMRSCLQAASGKTHLMCVQEFVREWNGRA